MTCLLCGTATVRQLDGEAQEDPYPAHAFHVPICERCWTLFEVAGIGSRQIHNEIHRQVCPAPER